ncbi:non-ribosomal peptide synthetase/MFS transporter [Microbacterium marinilacus]|uniref:Amino acid adenylation domain-containing protein n=1 Tax=Microbacterium marinilacus TaxID=415209 RepID=A0ABP7BMN7_9MICO|nr:non-ribosomal peptide synthetase/MFS transporter [Microbacterium marinilacus]MBY0690363.1 amino acid adenylation domain-containing protein [Microbacterium marinilacus]
MPPTSTAPVLLDDVWTDIVQQIETMPDAIALADGEGDVTYGRLEVLVSDAAQALREAGVRRGDLVGIHLPRGRAAVIGALAALSIGAGYVPLDPVYPEARLTFMQEQTRPRAVLTAQGVRVMSDGAKQTDPAYVIFTSGSTGLPKGVLIGRRALTAFARTFARTFSLSASDRVLQFASMSFDVSVEEIFPTLTRGATVVLRDDDMIGRPELFLRRCGELGITVLDLPTAYWHELVTAVSRGEAALPESVRCVIIGGETARPDAVRQWRRALGAHSARLFNTYGPTETTVGVTAADVTEWDGDIVPIGVPHDGVTCRIGEDDELLVGGIGVADGYLGQPDLTAERFIVSPDGAREYRTGDRARWSSDGHLEFLGRIDDQVKISGHRVEPGEVEAALREIAGIDDAVVLVDSSTGRARLMGHVVADDTIDLTDVRAQLARTLPPYLVPATLASHRRFPLTPQGKVDKRALESDERSERVDTPDESPSQTASAALFEEVLGVRVAGTDDDFLSLGGDSLDAVRLLTALRREHAVTLSLSEWYAAPTVGALASAIASADGVLDANRAGSATGAVATLSEGVEHPLSPMQRDYWIAEQLCADLSVYTLGLQYRWTDEVDESALRLALDGLAHRHPLLRARFPEVDGEPRLVIDADATVALTVGEADRAAVDYRRGPIAHAFLDGATLTLLVHHLAFDGWSAGVFGQELAALYRAALPNGAAPALPASRPALDLAVRDAAAAVDPVLRDYWRERLSGSRRDLALPADRPRPAVPSYASARVVRHLPAETMARLRKLSGDERASLFHVVLAALQTVLRRHTGTTDITVLSPVAGRDSDEASAFIGPALNVLPLRGEVADDATFAEHLRRVRDATVRDLDHAALALPDLMTLVERSGNRAPLSSVMLTVHNTPHSTDPMLRYAGEVPPVASMVELSLAIDFPVDGAVLTADYALDLFDRERVDTLLSHLITVLDAVADDTSKPAAMVPMLSADEVLRLQDAGRCDPAPALHSRTVHELFEEHARRTPDAPALTVSGETISYGGLNRRANRLARHLQDEGAGPGDRVAIVLPRGVELFVAMWAVLKAGAAYVPVDPDYPAQRRAGMISDSAPLVVIDAEYLRAQGTDHSDGDLVSPAGSDDPAYVVFTSGSTGKPKGVVVTHGNLVHAVAMWREAYALRSDWSYLQAASFSFDMFVGETLRALTTGGRLVVVGRETVLDPPALFATMRDERIACTELVPAVLRALLDEAERGDGGGLSSVRLLIGGGEKWHVRDYRRARALVAPQARVVNSYGVTEATVDNLYFDGDADDLADDELLPIGRPFPGNSMYVLDPQGNHAPFGVIGELFLGGNGVAAGYHGRPELSAERFVPDPFSDAPDARMYRTGDAARFRADGTVDFLGRLDDQVKLNGHRIELGEVESALGSLPGIAACAAAVHDRGTGLDVLVGYVVLRRGVERDESTIRAGLAAFLPPHMVPGRVLVLEALPSSPNGKLDRRALPAPAEARPDTTAEPGTETERRIAAVWADVLGIATPGIDESFFALGGDSFAALKTVRRLDPAPSLVEFYEHATIRRLAAHLDDRERSGPTSTRLLHRLTPAAEAAGATLTVVAVPYSGGSAVAYRPLAEALPSEWALEALELPGHDGSRPDEALEPLDVVAERVVAEVAEIDGPVLFYGHCLGVALTVELARRAEANGIQVAGVALGAGFPTARLPGRVFDWIYRHLPVDRLSSDREYLEYLRARGGFSDLDADEQAFTLRNVRHDTRDAEEYFTAAYRSDIGRLKAPVLSVVGARDRVTEHYQERHREWAHFTEGEVGLTVLPGAGHFFVKDHAHPLAEALADFTARGTGDADPRETTAISSLDAEPQAIPDVQPSLRRFGVVAIGQLLSMVGSSLSSFVLSIWVFQQTGSITDFAVVNAVGLLPGIVAGPFAGAIADRWDKRKVMIASDSVATAAMVALAALILSGGLSMWQVYATVAVTSLAGAFQRPAYLSAVAQLVPKRYLGNAAGIGQLGAGVGQVFAPLLGASLIGLIGIGGVLILDMVTFAIGVFTLLITRFPKLAFRRREESFGAEVRNGWRYIRRRPGLRSALRYFVIDHVFYVLGFAVITPLLLLEQPPAIMGAALGATGVGALLGSVAMGIWGGTARRTHGMLLSMAIGSVAMMVVGLTSHPVLLILGMFVMGVAESLADGHWTAVVQGKVGLELQGRVLSIFLSLMLLTVPVGYLVVGPLAETYLQPLLEPGGAWADTLGLVTGVGPGRALALLIVLSGLLQLGWAIFGWSDRRLRLLEDDLPDAIPSGVIGTKDDLQRAADEALTRSIA